MKYLCMTSFLYWHRPNQHTTNFSRSTEHSISWETSLSHQFHMFWQSHMGKKITSLWFLQKQITCLCLAFLPHLIFWIPMELGTCKKTSCILQFLCWWLLLQYWILSPCLVHHRLAAVALLVLEDEESAFWCLVYIVENLMPADYYSETLITSQVSWAPSHLLGLSYSDVK